MMSSRQARSVAITAMAASALVTSACDENSIPLDIRDVCPTGTIRDGPKCVTDPATIRGCTDESAANYNPRAGIDDGSCSNAGCTDMAASNYNPRATEDDGSCFREGCTAAAATNYDPAATREDGSCTWPLTFRVDMSGVDGFSPGAGVYLRADFNEFCEACDPMADDDADGVYEIDVELTTGVYDYVFAYGDAPGTAEVLPEDCETRTEEGQRRVEVSTAGQQLDPIAFGACEQVSLPFTVSDAYAISGFMGEGENNAVGAISGCPERAPGAVGTCFTFTYTPVGAPGWAGVFWQNPDGNWGEEEGFAMPPGATKVRFYAWTEGGGETVAFGAGMGGVDPFSVEVGGNVMNTTPTEYEIDLGAVTYESIVGAFVWTASAPAAPMTLYVDSVVWEGEEQ